MALRLGPLPYPEYEHDHAPVENVNEVVKNRSTLGDIVADKVAATVGSWRFVIVQSIILFAWLVINVTAWIERWDPYPFILLNLVLSFQAAYTAPIIMMSQNRQASKDRIEAEHDYAINTKAEEEIKVILDRLDVQHEILSSILEKLSERDATSEFHRERDAHN